MAKPSVNQVEELIDLKKGNVSAVARALGYSRTQVYKWISDSPTLQRVLDDSRETMVDTAESLIYKRMAVDDDLAAAMYVLNNSPQAKRRGWGPKVQQEHSGEMTVKGYGIISPDDWDHAGDES